MITKLRQGNLQDAPAIADILSNWIDETDWMPRIHSYDEDRGFGAFLVEKTQVIVAESGASIVGFLALRDANIQALYLRPVARNLGLGKRLLDYAKKSHNALTLWAFQENLAARRFYAREGFREVEMTDGNGNDEKLPDVRLVWQRETSNG